MPYFFHSGYVDSITISEIDSVLSYLDERSGKDKSYILVEDEFKVISIIDKPRQTCYIYSNSGINFNLKNFFHQLLNYQNDFSAIVCDELIYNRLKQYLYEEQILLETVKDIYSMDAKALLCEHTPFTKTVKQTIILTDFIHKLLHNPFFKTIDDKNILFINDHYAGVITVTSSLHFINTFYDVLENNFKVHLDSKNDIFILGDGYGIKDHVTIYDLDESIESIVVIRNSRTCYEIVYTDSIYNDYHLQLILLIQLLKHENDLYYFLNHDYIDVQSLTSLGFKLTSKKVYFYYFHHKSDPLRNIPILRHQLVITNNLKFATIKYLSNVIIIVIFVSYNFIFKESKYDVPYYFLLAFLMLSVSIPTLLTEQTKFLYQNKVLKINKLNIHYIQIILIILMALFSLVFRFTEKL